MNRSLFLSLLTALAVLVAGLGPAWAQDVPAGDEVQSLVKATMLDFALAVKAKDFSGFYKTIAKFWQDRTSAQELARIFKDFVDQEIDLTALDELQPTFTKKPALNGQGWLVVQGAYASKPSTVDFILSYKKEAPGWKLVGIEVNVAPSRPELPTQESLTDMVKATILDLAIAIKAKDFKGFYNKISSLWKEQTTSQGLAENFRSFTDQNIDLTVLQALEPVFTAKPALDENDWLTVDGYYPSQPSRTYFKMKYLNEAGAWKLAAIDLNVTPESSLD